MKYTILVTVTLLLVASSVIMRYEYLPQAIKIDYALNGFTNRYYTYTPNTTDFKIHKGYIYTGFFKPVVEIGADSAQSLLIYCENENYSIEEFKILYTVNQKEEWLGKCEFYP